MKRLSEVITQDLKEKNILKNLHRPHFRLTTLAIYFVFILIFNIIIAPAFGLNSTVNAATNIDSSRLVDLANQDRAQNGNLAPLTLDPRLVTAATNKAIDMFKKQYWAHYGPNGETPWQFIVGAGYNYTYAGENLAKDFTDTDSVNTAWMNSTTHKANILNTNYKNIGIAAVSGKQICNGTYPDFPDNNTQTCIDTVIVVQMFGSPVGSTNSPSTTVTKTSVPAKTVTPTTAAPKAPSAPAITNPQNGSSVNNGNVEIKGTTDNDTSVSVFEGDKKIGTITSSDGSFDIKDTSFEEGDHTISATAKSNTNSLETAAANNVKFTVDTQKPIFNNKNITIQLNDKSRNEYYVEGTFSDDTTSVKVSSDQAMVNLQNKDGTKIFGGILKIENNSGITISAYDKAGNVYSELMNLPSTPLGSPSALSVSSDNTGIATRNLNTRQTVNVIVGVLVLFIFFIDSILLWRTGRHLSAQTLNLHKHTIQKSRGSLFHHIMPIAIVIIAILTTFSGKIV